MRGRDLRMNGLRRIFQAREGDFKISGWADWIVFAIVLGQIFPKRRNNLPSAGGRPLKGCFGD